MKPIESHPQTLRQLLNHDLLWSGSGGTLADFRQSGKNYFINSDFPTPKTEEWQFTNIRPILNSEYVLPDNGSAQPWKISNPPYAGDCIKIDILNGIPVVDSSLQSKLDTLKIGLEILDNDNPGPNDPQYFMNVSGNDLNAFTALNMVLTPRIVLLDIPDEVRLDVPVMLNFISNPGTQPMNANFHGVITGGRYSEFTLIESYTGSDQKYFNNPVINISLAEGAKLNYDKIQDEGQQSFHIANTRIHLNSSARIDAAVITTGGQLVRNDLDVNLIGEGSQLNLMGLSLGKGTDHFDNRVIVNHRAAHSTSKQLLKNILNERSHGVFNGLIRVFDSAIQTDAEQKNQNLLLSHASSMNSNPQLEINTDDVRCAHGSTTGELDDDAIFYLRSRGIAHDSARKMLIYGFARQILDNITYQPLNEHLSRYLGKYLAKV